VRLSTRVRLCTTHAGRTVAVVEARALLQVLMPERARFVRLARTRTATEADAEDVVQRALARAADRAASLDDLTKARAWFYRILRRTIADARRVGVHDPMRLQTATEFDTLADERIAATQTACACGVRLLDELRPNYSEVVRRIDLNGEAPSVVASELGISIDNLNVRLHRARGALRRDVQAYCGVSSHIPCLDCACDTRHRCGSASACAEPS
jgi:RNA polymerase sigma factor (sigma-70 family)